MEVTMKYFFLLFSSLISTVLIVQAMEHFTINETVTYASSASYSSKTLSKKEETPFENDSDTITYIDLTSTFHYKERFSQQTLAQKLSGTYFENTAVIFLDAAKRYQIDVGLLVAIAFAETGGNSKKLTQKRNGFGIKNPSLEGFKWYKNINSSIYDAARLLTTERYNHKSLKEIWYTYCPPGSDEKNGHLNANWGKNVIAHYNSLIDIQNN